MRSLSTCALCLVAAGAMGCAGARYDLEASTAKYPISLSPALLDRSGKVVYLGEDLRSKGAFEIETTEVGFFYSATGGTLDVSDSINSEVEERKGEGVVSLAATTENCALNWIFPLTLLPFWPGCQNVTVTGIVVERRARGAGAKGGAR